MRASQTCATSAARWPTSLSMRTLSCRQGRRRLALIESIGRGGFAEAWRARRLGGVVEDDVCVKLPLCKLSHEQRKYFIEEARVMSRVRHSNIVALLDALEHESYGVVIVMEWVQGITLARLCASARRGAPLPDCVVASVGACLCRALGAAQRAVEGGVVHRDVTPGNVLISREGEVKLCDFGIARARDRQAWTGRGRVKGKSAYVSPEQLAGETLDVRSDLFAVGVVLHELLTGERPFTGAGPAETLRNIADGRRRPAPPSWHRCQRELRACVDALLARDPAARPFSADAAGRALARLANPQRAFDLLGCWARVGGPGIHKPRRTSLPRGTSQGEAALRSDAARGRATAGGSMPS